MVPIPVANFCTWKASLGENSYIAGVYITASHNPAEYNGIRFRHPDGAGYTEGNIEIKRMFFEEQAEEHSEHGEINILSTEEMLRKYTDFVKSKMNDLSGMRIAIDPGNGVGSIIIDELFQKFGVETKCINNEPDGKYFDFKVYHDSQLPEDQAIDVSFDDNPTLHFDYTKPKLDDSGGWLDLSIPDDKTWIQPNSNNTTF